METITVTRPVLVKVRVTEPYRKARVAALQNTAQRIDLQMQQLEYQAKKIVTQLEQQNPQAVGDVRCKIEGERQGLLDTRQKITAALKETGRWMLGDVVTEGRVESLVEIKVGDRWSEVMSVEVILQDGVVMEIRAGGGVVDSSD